MAIEDFVYQNNQVTWRVEILGQDVSEYVARSGIGSIRQSLDTNFLTEFQVGDCQLSLNDAEGYFATSRESNFFTENTWAASGYLARIEIHGGFRNPSTNAREEVAVFRGVIISVNRDSKTGVVSINASDNSEINRQDVSNFGLTQESKLAEGTQRTIRGQYEFNDLVSPVSEDSVIATLSGEDSGGSETSTQMVQKNTFDDFGELSDENFQIQSTPTTSQLLTEEAVNSVTDGEISAEYKSPYRYRHVTENVRGIANYFNVQIANITSVNPSQEDRFFASIGRLQARFAQNDADEEFTWRGIVTDFLVNPENNIIYALISDRVSTVMPRFVEYDPTSEVSRIIYSPLLHQEYWKLATADFETFYILNTRGTRENGLPVLASYNPSEWNDEAMPQTAVTKYVLSTSTPTEILHTGTLTRPQIATFHFFGVDRDRLGFVPDSRQNFQVARGVLFYRYANRTHFGLARYRESDGNVTVEIQIQRDGRNNEASFDFAIDETNNKIYGSHTTQSATRSQLLVYEKALAGSY